MIKSVFFDLLQFQLLHPVLQLLGRDRQFLRRGIQPVGLVQGLRDNRCLILGQQLPKVHLAPAQLFPHLGQLLTQYEAAIISEALRQTNRLNAAADKLSISPQKLQCRMEKLKLK